MPFHNTVVYQLKEGSAATIADAFAIWHTATIGIVSEGAYSAITGDGTSAVLHYTLASKSLGPRESYVSYT